MNKFHARQPVSPSCQWIAARALALPGSAVTFMDIQPSSMFVVRTASNQRVTAPALMACLEALTLIRTASNMLRRLRPSTTPLGNRRWAQCAKGLAVFLSRKGGPQQCFNLLGEVPLFSLSFPEGKAGGKRQMLLSSADSSGCMGPFNFLVRNLDDHGQQKLESQIVRSLACNCFQPCSRCAFLGFQAQAGGQGGRPFYMTV